ncbi:MAG: hypothetical protein K2L72_02815 [Clostridia bacterium]|nr:hypothetical protein [Clostridia bacterium]
MAEERLIDDDKDKKYRIKLNADGEEELVIEGGEEPQPAEEAVFDVPEVLEDSEEEAVMTPEQLAAKREREEQERKERQRQVDELLQKATAECALYRYATALEFLEQAEEIDGGNGEIHALKLSAYTRNFTDYSQIVPASEFAEDVEKYVSAEKKAELFAVAEPSLEQNIAELRANVSDMNKRNEAAKAERAVKFNKDRKTALIAFAAVFALFACFGALTGYFASIIYTVSTGLYLILTCVFGGLTLISLIGLAVAARYVNIMSRRVRLNKRNTTTQLGRDLLTEQAKLKAFIAVYSAL